MDDKSYLLFLFLNKYSNTLVEFEDELELSRWSSYFFHYELYLNYFLSPLFLNKPKS